MLAHGAQVRDSGKAIVQPKPLDARCTIHHGRRMRRMTSRHAVSDESQSSVPSLRRRQTTLREGTPVDRAWEPDDGPRERGSPGRDCVGSTHDSGDPPSETVPERELNDLRAAGRFQRWRCSKREAIRGWELLRSRPTQPNTSTPFAEAQGSTVGRIEPTTPPRRGRPARGIRGGGGRCPRDRHRTESDDGSLTRISRRYTDANGNSTSYRWHPLTRS